MSAQVPLPIVDRVRKSLESAAEEIRAELRRVAKRTKQGAVLARAANMDPGDFSKALAGDRDDAGRLVRKLDVESLPAFFAEDQDGTLIRLLCRLCRGQFVPDPEVTPEERLEALKRACRNNGNAGAAILREAGEDG